MRDSQFRATVGGYVVTSGVNPEDVEVGCPCYVLARPDGGELGRDLTWMQVLERIREDRAGRRGDAGQRPHGAA